MQSLVLNMNSTLFEQLFSFARMKVCARLCSWINFTLFHSNQTLESKGKERSYLCINTFYMLCMSDVAAVAHIRMIENVMEFICWNPCCRLRHFFVYHIWINNNLFHVF